MRLTLLVLFPLIATLGTVQAREFEDTFGRLINAELVAHWGAGTGLVKIEKDGKNLTVKVSDFAEKHQKEILKWMKEHPKKLDALIEPPASGDGVMTGSKWLYLRSGVRPIQLELGGLSKMIMNGVINKTARWEVQGEKVLAMRWYRSPIHYFSTPMIANRVFSDDRNRTLIIRLDRLPKPPTTASLTGKSFVLINARSLKPWTGSSSKGRVAIVEFKEAGKATVGQRDFEWRVTNGVIQLKSRSDWKQFGACALDIYVDSSYNVLWQVAPPTKKK